MNFNIFYNFFRYPAEILEKFTGKTFLLQKSTKEIIKKIVEKSGYNDKKSLNNELLMKFEKTLIKYQAAKEGIQKIFAYDINEKLFVLNIKECKEIMLQKAEKVINTTLKKLRDIFHSEIEVLIKNYEENLLKLTHIPESEEELMQLRILVEKKDEFLEEMRVKAEYLNKILDIFDRYFYEIPVNISIFVKKKIK